MTDKELIYQLQILKAHIRPDASWRARNKAILECQINGTKSDDFVYTKPLFKPFFQFFAQPIGVLSAILIFIVLGGFASALMSRNAKPGDSFYIAKILSEKAQLAVTFKEEKVVQLNLDFARARVEEIKEVITDNNNQNIKKDEIIKQLSDDAQNKIRVVKKQFANKIQKINQQSKTISSISAPQTKISASATPVEKQAGEVFSASSGRAEQGIGFSPYAANNVDSILNEAQSSINQKDYDKTLQKLNEASSLIIEESNNIADDEQFDIIKVDNSAQSTSSVEATK